MYRTFFKPLGLLITIALVGLIASCQKEDDITSVENFVSTSVNELQERSGAGIYGCYELVFPVSIQFADSSIVAVNSYDELKDAIRTWYETNGGHPRPGQRPTMVFPFQVTNDAGEIITVENQEQLKELKSLCRPNPGGPGHHGGHHGNGKACYTFVFPLTLQFPDSTQAIVNSAEEFRTALHTWKENNPGSHTRPTILFPFTVTLKDGSQVVVNNREELRAIKEACRG